jgi:hypothetical protein
VNSVVALSVTATRRRRGDNSQIAREAVT